MKAEISLVIFKMIGHVSTRDIFRAFLWEWEEGEMICFHYQTRRRD